MTDITVWPVYDPLISSFSSMLKSVDSSLIFEEREKRMRQAAGRAVFIQDLLASTLLAD
jgi:hypothetical protein